MLSGPAVFFLYFLVLTVHDRVKRSSHALKSLKSLFSLGPSAADFPLSECEPKSSSWVTFFGKQNVLWPLWLFYGPRTTEIMLGLRAMEKRAICKIIGFFTTKYISSTTNHYTILAKAV